MGHHYVPRKYLKGFTDPSEPLGLWQFDKKTNSYSRVRASIAKIAQEPGYYDGEVESLLNELVEIPGNRALDQLRLGNFTLSEDDRLSLATYMATMTHRVPVHRAKADKMGPDVLKDVTARMRDEIRQCGREKNILERLVEQRIAELDEIETRMSESLPPEVQDSMYCPWPSARTIGLIYTMHWRFVHAASDQKFVTSDNPVFYFEYYGLARRESEITFPVSSELAIFGNWVPFRPDGEFVDDKKLVKEVNRRTVIGAHRFVFTRRREPWLGKVAKKDQTQLNRINWGSTYAPRTPKRRPSSVRQITEQRNIIQQRPIRDPSSGC
ncbi:DUF4238 domain-containing protein [Novipirellula sp.]|uniref:DUF4238 domain-containing protein n=1 Tax=Novipirellula sp. TaxID=2795430 RepID=UPI0035692E25